MPMLLIILSIGFCLAGAICILSGEFEGLIIGVVLMVLSYNVFGAGKELGQLRLQVEAAQQQKETVKAAYQVQLRNLDAKFMEAQDEALRLTFENKALQEQQSECVNKQQVSQGTLSDIKEILEN